MNISRRNTLRYLKRNTNKSMDIVASQVTTTMIKEPDNKIEEYVFSKILGKGSYAIVKLAHHKKTGDIIAIKTYDKIRLCDPLKKASVDREIKILKSIEHPNIIKYIDCFDNKRQLHLIMEYAGQRSLYEYIKANHNRCLEEQGKPFWLSNKQEAKGIFRQIVEAISYLHKKSIAHRDLKLENIIFTSKEQVKIIDFGFSIQSNSKLRTFCGTPTYMAPELVRKSEYWGHKVDVWALGVLLYRMLTGIYPFRGKFLIGTNPNQRIKIESCIVRLAWVSLTRNACLTGRSGILYQKC